MKPRPYSFVNLVGRSLERPQLVADPVHDVIHLHYMGRVEHVTYQDIWDSFSPHENGENIHRWLEARAEIMGSRSDSFDALATRYIRDPMLLSRYYASLRT